MIQYKLYIKYTTYSINANMISLCLKNQEKNNVVFKHYHRLATVGDAQPLRILLSIFVVTL